MFVALTMGLLMLGWWVNRAERQRRAVRTLQAAGVDIRYLHYGPFCGCCGCWEGEPKSPGLWVLSKFLPKDFYDPVSEVNFHDVEVTPEVLRASASFPHVMSLKIGRSKLTDVDLECLHSMSQLRELHIGMPVGEAGLRNIGRLRNLRYLGLHQTPATPGNLALISHLNLFCAHLDFTFATDESLAVLGSCKSLESIDLSHSQVTNTGIAQLFSKLEQVSVLRLNDTVINDETLAHIARLPHLEWLELSNTSITDRGLEYFVSSPSKVFMVEAQYTCATEEGCNRINQQLDGRGGVFCN